MLLAGSALSTLLPVAVVVVLALLAGGAVNFWRVAARRGDAPPRKREDGSRLSTPPDDRALL